MTEKNPSGMDETTQARQPGEPSNNKPAPDERPAAPGPGKAVKPTQPAKE